jgi:hypothetical protein
VEESRLWFSGLRLIQRQRFSVAYYQVQTTGWKERFLGGSGGESGFVWQFGECEFRGGGRCGGGKSGFVWQWRRRQFGGCGIGGGVGCVGVRSGFVWWWGRVSEDVDVLESALADVVEAGLIAMQEGELR